MSVIMTVIDGDFMNQHDKTVKQVKYFTISSFEAFAILLFCSFIPFKGLSYRCVMLQDFNRTSVSNER